MKKYVLFIAVFIATAVFAQDVDSFFELLRSDLKTGKKEIITMVMDFTDSEASAFWPIYREYEFGLDELGDARLTLTKNYAENYENMTDEKATELINDAIKFQQDRLKLRKKYFKKFSKALSPIQAAKWIQLENQIHLLIDLQIASEMPLVEKP